MPPVEAPVAPAPTEQVEQTPAANAEPEVTLAEQLGIDPSADHQPDSDEARILATLAELEKEDAAAADTAPAAQAPDATQQQPAPNTQQNQPQPTTQVPVAALQGLRREKRDLEMQLAEAKGKNEALTDLLVRGVITPEHARAVQEGRAELSPAHQAQVDPYRDLDTRDLALAKRYEDGDISHVDYRKEQIALDRERQSIDRKVERQARQEEAIEAAKPRAEQIQAAFPSLEKMSQDQLQACAPVARINTQAVLTNRGLGKFDPSNPEHLRIFHFQVAHLADHNFNGGRDWTAFQASRKSGAQPAPNGQQPNPTVPHVVSRPGPTRVTDPAQIVRDKIKQSQTQAPDLTGMQDRQHTTPTQQEQQIVNMTTEQVAAMDPALRNQLLGIT